MLEVSLQLAENVDVGRERPLTEVNTIDTVPSLIFRCGGTISITTLPHSTLGCPKVGFWSVCKLGS